jgi:hypothetical protein
VAGVAGGVGVSKGQKRSKIHHYVPKVLQRYFRCGKEQIWYSSRQKGELGAPELRNISSTFQKRNYYTVFKGNEPSDIVEKEFFGEIDDYLGRVLPEFVSNLEQEIVPTFEGKARSSLDQVVFQLIKRTPDFLKEYEDEEKGRELIEEELKTALASGVDVVAVDQLQKFLNDSSFLRGFGRHVRVKAQISRSKKVEEMLREFDIRWGRSTGRHSFVLSSQIAYRIGNGGSNGISNSKMEIWMPISPKFALVMLREPDGKIPLIAGVPRDHMREINEYAARNSDSLASHSQRLLSSLVS